MTDYTLFNWARQLEWAMDGVVQDNGTKQVSDRKYDFMIEEWHSTRHLRSSERSDTELDAATIHQLFGDEYRLDHMLPLLEVLRETVSDLQSRFRLRLKSISSKLSKGLASLPDELLALIFEFATSSEKDGWRHAVWLSHVNRRFRSIIIGMKLWTTLDSRAGKEELEAVITRSGIDSGLHVIIRMEYSDDITSFVETCQHTANRWTTLRISSAEQGSDKGMFDPMVEHALGKLQLDFPALEKFSIDQEVPFDIMPWRRQFTPNWTAPNLRVFYCENYIPLPLSSPAYSSITTFDLVISMGCEDYRNVFVGLVAFLVAMPNISQLCVTIGYDTPELGVPQIDAALPPCPSITSFTLTLPSFRFSPNHPNTFPGPLIRLLRMPNLTEFHLAVTVPSHDKVVGLLLEPLFPFHTEHPGLTYASIDISCATEAAAKQPLIYQWHTTVPLDCIPHVTTFDMRSFARPLFARCDVGGLCSLKKARLRGWGFLHWRDFEDMISSLKDIGAWESLDVVEVEDCKGFLKEADVVDIPGAEKISIKRVLVK